ncbi:MAG: hypothetical protein QX198_09100, partial [Methylococcaceae bacterium]
MAGNVGIGTTAPTAKLDVTYAGGYNTGIAVRATSSYAVMTMDCAAGSYSILEFKRAGVQKWQVYSDNNLNRLDIYSFASSSVVAAFLDGTGVGIGTITPATKLHVQKDDGATGDTQVAVFGNATGHPYTTFGSGSNAGGYLIWNQAGNSEFGIGTHGTPAALNIKAGNVGIGTTAPTAKLDVANTTPGTWVYSSLSGNYSLVLGRADGTGVGSIKLNSYAAGAFSFIRPSNGNLHVDSTTGYYYFNWDASVYGTNPGTIVLGDAASADRVHLSSSGSSWFNGGGLGIGTTSPSQRLDIVSATNDNYDGLVLRPANLSQTLYVSWNGFSSSYAITSTAVGVNGLSHRFQTSGVDKVTFSTSGNITASGSLAVNSAADITTLNGSLTLYASGNTTTSMLMFKNTTGLGWGNHGAITGTYNTYFVMDTTDRGWIFRNATTAANVASISNTGV